MSYNINRKKRVVEELYYNENYGTCLRVHKYNTSDELKEILERLN